MSCIMLEVAQVEVEKHKGLSGIAEYYHTSVFWEDQRVMRKDREESRQMVGALMQGWAHQHLVDFDCHLDAIRQGWTNQRLNTQITQ